MARVKPVLECNRLPPHLRQADQGRQLQALRMRTKLGGYMPVLQLLRAASQAADHGGARQLHALTPCRHHYPSNTDVILVY